MNTLKKNIYLFSFVVLIGSIIKISAQIPMGERLFGDSQQGHFASVLTLNAAADILAIGEPFFYSGGNSEEIRGQVKVFTYSNDEWQQLGQTIQGELFSDTGFSLDINDQGDRLIIGAPRADGLKGLARVYDFNGSSWSQIGQDLIGANNGDSFGSAVRMNSSGTIIAVSSPQADINNLNFVGRVDIYELVGDEWEQMGSSLEGSTNDSFFGEGLDINAEGNVVAVGAAGYSGEEAGSGKVELFQFNGSDWTLKGSSIFGNLFLGNFGRSVALDDSGDRVVIGAAGENARRGSIRVYDFDTTEWIQLGETVEGPYVESLFGWAVDINSSGNSIVVGAPFSEANGSVSGEVRVYNIEGGDIILIGSPIEGVREGSQLGEAVVLSSDGRKMASGASDDFGDQQERFGYASVWYMCAECPENDEITLEIEGSGCELSSQEYLTEIDTGCIDYPEFETNIPDVFALGSYEVFWTIDDGVFQSTCSQTVNIIETISPEIDCPSSFVIESDEEGQFVIENYINEASISDNCTAYENLSITQVPPPGTVINAPNIVDVTLSVTDFSSNLSQCTFQIEIQENLSLSEYKDSQMGIDIFPNPALSIVNISSSSTVLGVEIYDLNGNHISPDVLSTRANHYVINIEKLVSGVYFLNINTGNISEIKKLIVY